MLLQLVLDSRHLIEDVPAGVDDVTRGMDGLAVGGGAGASVPSSSEGKEPAQKQ